MKLEVVVSAKQANPVYNDGLPRNGQGKMDDSLDNPDGRNMDDRSKVECKTKDDCATLVTEMEAGMFSGTRWAVPDGRYKLGVRAIERRFLEL